MKDLSKLALAGILGGTLAATNSSCTSETPKGQKPNAEQNVAETQQYSDVHTCRQHNTCKGLGGCNVSVEQLALYAKEAGVPLEKAGEKHTCKGLNECKGLGGCGVTPELFAKLSADLKK